jgi:hypothetical protein
MTGPVQERTYRWPRRFVFTATLAATLAVIMMLFVLWLVV